MRHVHLAAIVLREARLWARKERRRIVEALNEQRRGLTAKEVGEYGYGLDRAITLVQSLSEEEDRLDAAIQGKVKELVWRARRELETWRAIESIGAKAKPPGGK